MTETSYVKFINSNAIEHAPKNKGNVSNYHLDTPSLLRDGYLPLQTSPCPGPGYALSYALHDDAVTEIWTEIPAAAGENDIPVVDDSHEAVTLARARAYAERVDPLICELLRKREFNFFKENEESLLKMEIEAIMLGIRLEFPYPADEPAPIHGDTPEAA